VPHARRLFAAPAMSDRAAPCAPEAPAGAAAADVLPAWDLSDLYPGPESPAVAADLDSA